MKKSEKATANPQARNFVDAVEQTTNHGRWSEELNLDRFVILVFLTAEEKQAFAEAQLGDACIDYFDGDDVESIKLKRSVK